VTLESYVAELSGETIVLPNVRGLQGPIVVLARRPGSNPDRVIVESLQVVATRVVRPMSENWPAGPFRCDRAEFSGGRVLFYQGDDAFGFAVDPEGGAVLAGGEVERAALDDGGIAGALDRLEAAGVLSSSVLEIPPQTAEEAPVEAVPAEGLKTPLLVPPSQPRALGWRPSWISRVVLILVGVAIAAWGVALGSRGFEQKALETELLGIALMALGALLLGYNLIRLAPPQD
jgi:hypothetical protein